MRDSFGDKHLGEIRPWRTVKYEFNLDYETGIPKSYLSKAIRGALGLTENKSKDAVSIGKEFYLLIEDDSVDTIDLKYDNESRTIHRLVLPSEGPDLYCDDVEQYTDRDKWAGIWEAIKIDGSEALPQNVLIDTSLNPLDIDTDSQAKAVIASSGSGRNTIDGSSTISCSIPSKAV